ncbi:MAG TPA: bifunctional adenosylcobinamide kinase/adenosylcobinamide-phosphate guanylyltransferase [Terriglobales bacterium]|nr:bifunctional adenosylcobinamide kinase/adenosylcobinamide-phosphate guanylyltransferase [Terriglobales bacterium]
MSRLVLITGGCRSGKSDFAVALAHSLSLPTLFLATCDPGQDTEMHARVAAHRRARPVDWRLREESLAPALALAEATEPVIVLDCIPTWLGNLLVRGTTDENIGLAGAELEAAIRCCRARWILAVTAEVGAGLVPETALGRRFRDCVGSANQRLAAFASRTVLLVAGLPIDVSCLAQSAAGFAGLLREDTI